MITNNFDILIVDLLHLHPDRFFDPEREVRGIARELYEEVADLPLVCPHGHVTGQMRAGWHAHSPTTSCERPTGPARRKRLYRRPMRAKKR